MLQLSYAGLNRIHIGMESGSDAILAKTDKGISKAGHISAGRRVKGANIELSEYVMPGLGGKDLSEEHAIETADALNQIDPDFIRLRTLSVPPGIPLYDEYQSGTFIKCTDLEVVQEIRLLIGTLTGIRSRVKSDHFYNLLQLVDGQLPDDKTRMLRVIDEFLDLPTADKVTFQLGRRLGYFQQLSDMHEPTQRVHVEGIQDRLNITAENIDRVIDERLRMSI
jgi:radical SAM superfamily enzyme